MVTSVHAVTNEHAEARFFFIMASAMAATIVAGFSGNFLLGRSTFQAPLIVHLHAVTFMSWVALYLLQNALVFSGNQRLHRKLGWLALLLVPLMIVLGIAITLHSLQTTGGPPFFDQNEFLIGNPVGILTFAGLVGWALALRRHRNDWHRRLMYCAMAVLTGPALGRLLPMPFLIPWAWWVANLLPLTFILIAMAADRRRSGSIHPAWWRGIAVILVYLILADVVAYSPIGTAVTDWVLAGTPGAERAPQAFFPT